MPPMSTPDAGPPIALAGVRVRHLRIDRLVIPRGRFTVVAGVAGSGKTTLLRDVLHAEGQRRYVASLSASARRLLERRERPDADEIAGVPPSFLVDPDDPPGRGDDLVRRAGLDDPLRAAFAALAEPCEPTTGEPLRVTTAADAAAALVADHPGGRAMLGFAADPALSADAYRHAGFGRFVAAGTTGKLEEVSDLPAGAAVLADRVKLTEDGADRVAESLALALRFGGGRATAWVADDAGAVEVDGKRWAAVVVRDRPVLADGTVLPPPTPSLWASAVKCPTCGGRRVMGAGGQRRLCPTCGGTKRHPAVFAYRVAGVQFAEWKAMTAADLAAALPADGPPVVAYLATALERLAEWGLDRVPLDTPAAELSRADDRRAVIAAAADPGVRGLLCLFDAPLAGLGGDDAARFLALVRRLTDGGCTVVAASSDPVLCEAADRLVELGPGAGADGGRVLFAGVPSELAGCDGSVVAPFLSNPAGPPPGDAAATLALPDDADTKIVPRGLTVLTGPAADERLRSLAAAAEAGGWAERKAAGFGEILFGPRGPLTRSKRSTAATFLGFFGEVRAMFAATPEAKLRQLGPGHFSLAGSSPGRCPVCGGAGTVTTPMQFLPDLVAVCPECGGDRFKPEVLAVRVRGASIAGVLDLTADEAVPFFRGRPKPRARAAAVRDVGLGHLAIGRPTHTLSAGEGQRLRLAKVLAARTIAATLVLLEDPAAGLHPADADRLAAVFRRLCENGHAVVASGSHPRLLAAADAVVATA